MRAPSTPAGVRWKGVSSAPDRVVGIAATCAPVTPAIALAVSITRPPPSATSGACTTSASSAAEISSTRPAGTCTTCVAPSSSGALADARSVVSRAYSPNPDCFSRSGASAAEPSPKRIVRSPSRMVKDSAAKGPDSALSLRGWCLLGLALEHALGLGRHVIRQGVRDRAQIGLARRLQYVGGHAHPRRELAVELQQDVHLAERVAPAGDRGDVVLLQARLVAGRGVERTEEGVHRAVAGEAARLDLAVRHAHLHVRERRAGGGRLDVERHELER